MTLTMTLEGDRGVLITRRFAAPPARVWAAHVQPDLIRRWMFGSDGWTMTESVHENRPGGRFRYVWARSDGGSGGFTATGEILEVEEGRRMVHVERMFLPDPTPDNHIVTTFEPDGTGTRLTLRMTLPDAAARAAMLATGMTEGLEVAYARIDSLDIAA